MSLLSWLKGKNQPTQTTSMSRISSTIKIDRANADRVIIEQLRKVGLDLSAPLPIRYIFSAPSREKAQELAKEVEARGFHPELSEEGGRWKIAAPKEVVLAEDRMSAQRAEFTTLAQNFGGQYHGWEMKAKQTKLTKNVTRP